jgi:O-antigen/teichoic acid export membrane protein
VFIPYFGIVGAAIATLIAFAVGLIITLFYSFKSLRFDLNLKFISKSIVSSMLMSYIISLLQPEGLISILLTIGVCASMYFIFMCLLKGIDIKEFNSLHNLITN